MDINGFRTMLEKRKLTDAQIEASLSIVRRFENHVQESGNAYTTEKAWDFSTHLIHEKQNTHDNYLALARYGLFIQNNDVYVAFLELLDGEEAQRNLYIKVGDHFGENLRDNVFANIGLAPLGLPTPKKPAYMQPIIDRLEKEVGYEACRALLTDSLRDLPDQNYFPAIDRYIASKTVDTYLQAKKGNFVAELEACLRDGKPFFSQEITQEVIDFVRSDPEIGGGIRDGQIIYESKIPYMTRMYLDETDETLRRYYYCHCPWAREAIKHDGQVSPTFCNCSAGFHKKSWEVIFGQKLKVDVLETVLQNDTRCRFAIHLPEGVT